MLIKPKPVDWKLCWKKVCCVFFCLSHTHQKGENRNYRFFLLYVTMVPVSCLYTMGTVFAKLLVLGRNSPNSGWKAFAEVCTVDPAGFSSLVLFSFFFFFPSLSPSHAHPHWFRMTAGPSWLFFWSSPIPSPPIPAGLAIPFPFRVPRVPAGCIRRSKDHRCPRSKIHHAV